jgi:hypothetical protein
MRIEKHNGTVERRILTAMLVDNAVLSKIAVNWQPRMFKSAWANIVAEWCVSFHKRYNRPPKKDVQGIFESWAAENADKETVALVERFLVALSRDYEKVAHGLNSDYIVDQAGKYFNNVRLRRLAITLNGCLDSGKLDEAVKQVVSYNKVEVGTEAACDVFQDMNALKLAMTEEKQDLIKYPDALGHFFKGALTRDALVAIQAPEKRGKTFWLQDIAWRGMEQNLNVAFFGAGDMSQNQMLRRFIIRAMRRPIGPRKLKIPVEILHEPDEKIADVELKVKIWKKPLDMNLVIDRFKKMYLRGGKKSKLRLSCHPNSSLSVKGIDAILQIWERDGWIADVIVIDYADILAMPDGGEETRNQINECWKQLRALSQRKHCLVVTATQADASSYGADLMDMSNFSEDKRKNAHVTGTFGLNQTPAEKEKGIYRLNWIVLRESEFDTAKVVYVAGCLGIASPAMHSIF